MVAERVRAAQGAATRSLQLLSRTRVAVFLDRGFPTASTLRFNGSYLRLLVVLRTLEIQNNYKKRANRPEEQGSEPPPQAAPAFNLGKTGIDERESKPPNGIFSLHG